MALLELIDITQQFEAGYSLKAVNLTVDQGDVLALIGPTGAGKTTLIRIIDLLDWPASGQIIFSGTDVTHSKHERLQARRRMAYVQQRPTVFKMSIYDNVAMPLRWRRVPRGKIRQRVEQALDLVDLLGYQKRDARTLSGGETQRVAIARALVTEPQLLLLDEPTANLDPVTTSKIEGILARIIKEGSTTVVMSTHDMAQGQLLAQRIGVLMDGELVQVGQKGDIFKRPQNLKVAGFVGMDNIVKGVITSNEEGVVNIDVNGVLVESVSDYVAGEEVYVGIRPEDITLSFTKTSSSARNVFDGEIKEITYASPFANVELDCGFPLVVLITVRSAKEMELEIGKHLYASFKATAVHIVKV